MSYFLQVIQSLMALQHFHTYMPVLCEHLNEMGLSFPFIFINFSSETNYHILIVYIVVEYLLKCGFVLILSN